MKGDSIPEILKRYSQRVCRNESAEHTIKVTHKHPFTALKIHVSKRTRDLLERCASNRYQLSCRGLTEIKVKKSKRKVQGVPQSQTAALPRPQEEEETDKSKQAQTEQTYEKH